VDKTGGIPEKVA